MLRCERRQGRPEAALEACDEAVLHLKSVLMEVEGDGEAPLLAECLVARAKCLRAGGQLGEAVRDLERAQEILPASRDIKAARLKAERMLRSSFRQEESGAEELINMSESQTTAESI